MHRLLQSHSRALATAGVAAALGLLSLWLLLPESRIGTSLIRASYDWSQALLPEIALSNSPVVIVYLDLDSYFSEKQNPVEPWSRALHAQLVKRLTSAGAKAVVFDIIFDKANANSVADREFASAMRTNGKVVLAGEINPSSTATLRTIAIRSIEYSLPAKLFLDAAAAWGVATMREDSDIVVRQCFRGFGEPDPPSLTFAAASLVGVPAKTIAEAKWIRYYGKPFAIPHVSYSAALRTNGIPDEFFHNKIVLIGAGQMAGTFLERKDEFRSPMASWGDNKLFMPAVEVQATQLLNLLRGDSLQRLPPLMEGLLLLGTALLLGWLLFHFRPLPAAGIALVAEALVFGAYPFALAHTATWFPWMIIEAVQIPAALTSSVLWQSLQWYQQRRKFEEQRRANEAKIREQAALIEKAQDAILVQEMQGRIVYANPSAERLYGWRASEFSNSAVLGEFMPDETRRTALANGEWSGELEQRTRHGHKLTVASRCTLIRDELGRPKSFLFINTDVTEKKRLELEFFRAQRTDSIGALASGMAHDLNNAFAPILMGLQLLQQQRQDEETQRMLSVMEHNTHRGADMVKQVLLFSRGTDSERQPLSLSRLLREMEHIVRQTFPKSINVATLTPSDLWPVLGNATQLHQVLLNLCVNARDAMPSGGELTLAADNVELSAPEAVRIPNGMPGRFVMILVSDTGCGIPSNLLPRIFEPFFTTKPKERGTGLGLSTVARIVNQHYGFFNIRSEPNQGSTFEIYLPCASNTLTTETPAHPADYPRGQGQLILVADDEQSVLEMISLTLREQGYRVLPAVNGADALTQFQSHADAVCLALLDTDMPVMNGPQTIQALRAQVPRLPIVLMSGETDTNSTSSTASLLAKPFQLHELLREVARHLDGDSPQLR